MVSGEDVPAAVLARFHYVLFRCATGAVVWFGVPHGQVAHMEDHRQRDFNTSGPPAVVAGHAWGGSYAGSYWLVAGLKAMTLHSLPVAKKVSSM